MVTYARELVPAIRPFTTQREGEEVIIGNVETGVFLAIPPDAAEVLKDLAEGKSVGQASDIYEQKYGETPDLDDFLSLLEAKGILENPDSLEFNDSSRIQNKPEQRYHFSGFPQQLAQRLVSKPVVVACLVLVTFSLLAIVKTPSIAPGPRDLFFPERRALTWIIIVLFDLVTVFIHEMAHLIAARARGINSRMGMSNRLWNLVAETDLTGLWAVPRRQRYLPLLAGMLVDAVSGCLLVLLLFAQHQHRVEFPVFCLRLVRALSFGYLMRIVWEFFLFLRTDVYYVIATFFNCKNLLADTQTFLRNQLARVVRSIPRVDQSAIPDSELTVIRNYAVVWVAGRIWAIATLFYVTIPVGLSYIKDLSRVFRTGYSADPANFIDAVIMATIFLVPTTAGLALWIYSLVGKKRI